MKKILLAILFCGLFQFISAQTVGDYQSVANGNWNALATWQTWNGSAWVAAAAVPTAAASGTITITAGTTVTITAGATMDEVIVNGTLQTNTTAATGSFTIANGAGVDLTVNGTFIDNLTTGVITWAGTWQYGPTGTLIKTAGSSAANWQINYNGGNATMPSTAFWIMRKINTQQPALVTTSPASGSVYPNLIIENNTAAAWTTPLGSSFTGLAAFPTIKGNLDIGGSGTSTVDFLNSNTNASPMFVAGNVLIRTGSNYRNYGTGMELQGDLTVNGSITYDANDGRKLIFSGTNNQSVNGTGTVNIYDLTLNKASGAVTLNRPITVNNLGTFTGGIMYTTSVNLLSFASAATTSGASNLSFVSGPVCYYGFAAFTFPIGKNSDYQPLGISAHAATLSNFWTETFSNACANGCFAPYTGPNGTWTITATGTNNAQSNKWYVSGAECGNAAGACGSGCAGTDPSLHVGPNDGVVANDGGAHYDAGGLCGLGICVLTDVRAESPVINCTGHVGNYAYFNYMENGEGTLDNATMWYFDGATWSLLVDLPKTPTTCSPQGQWTAYSIALPASADNNPNVKIGFRWVNNDNGAGSDPSFAVDDISIGPAPETFTAEYFYADPQVVYNNILAPTLSSISACEYWILDRAPASSTAATSVTLTWDANSCPVIPSITDTRVAHFDLSMWQDEGNGGNTGTTAAGTVTSAAAVTYFSPFTIGLIPPTPLPVEMTRFDGNCNGNEVMLGWTTATETGNQRFTIERSPDGSTFSAIGNVNGAGNSTQLLNYHFTDHEPFAGTNYYRIKQTDYNGQYAYSRIIAVDAKDCAHNNLELVHAFFNPDELEIGYLYAKGPVTIEVYNAEGRLIRQFTDLPPESNYHIDATEWSSSIYFVRVSDGINSVSRTIMR